jgi:hypothetical protein
MTTNDAASPPSTAPSTPSTAPWSGAACPGTLREFFRFPVATERAVPLGKVIHAFVDTYATHIYPKVPRWLADPGAGPSTSPSIGLLDQRRRGLHLRPHPPAHRPGVFRSVADLQEAVDRTIRDQNRTASPLAGSILPTPSLPSSLVSLHLLNESVDSSKKHHDQQS